MSARVMRRAAFAAGLAATTLATGWGVREAGERERIARAATALRADSPALLGVSPDGRRLLLRVAEPGGFRLQARTREGDAPPAELPWAEKPVLATWRPDGEAVAFLADQAGNQAYQAYVWEVGSGRVRAVDGPATHVPQALAWDPAGTRLAFVAAPGGGPGTLYVLDPAKGTPAREVLRAVAPRAGVAWSPDGRRLAAARVRPRGEVSVVEPGGRPARAFLARGAEVRELAWRPDGHVLLAVLRPPRGEFFGLVEAGLASGTVRSVAAPAGDVSAPSYLPGGRIAFHVNRDSEREPVTCSPDGAGCRVLGGMSESTDLLGFSPAGDSAYLVVRGRSAAPAAFARALNGSGERPLHRPAPARSGVRGERVELRGRDGLRVPAYVWRAPRVPGRAPAALVRVHGGPAVQAVRSWDASVHYLVDAGMDVILLNYRGSTGYGARFENAPGGGAPRADDVLAARDYAVRVLGVPWERVYLYGHSYGALLAARAAARSPGLGGVVLVSLVVDDGDGGPPAPPGPGPRNVLVFHGENDPLAPREARVAAGAMLGEHALRGARVRIFPREGHAFQRVGTWAEVYAAVARLAEVP